MIKAIIFDMDGVLADTDKARFLVLQELLGKREIVLEKKYYKRSIGARTKEFLKELFEELISDTEIDDIYKELRAKPKVIEEQPHAASCCERLSKNFILAIGSGSQEDQIHLVLKTLGIDQCFSKIVGSNKIKRHKPDPETYLECLKALELEGKQCLAVEDSPRGVASAKGAGCFCVGVSYTHTKDELSQADMVISDLEHLTEDIISKI